MRKPCFIGLDNGGSTSKCAVFDQNGEMLATVSARLPMARDRAGRTERDAELIFQENCRLIREAIVAARIRASDISCLSLCGFGGGLGMLDESGRHIGPFIISTDSRAGDLLTAMEADGAAQAVRDRTGQNLWAGQPALLLPWLKRHEPELLARCRHIVTVKDYIRYRLTGALGTDMTDASNTNLFNITQRRFDPALFRILQIEELYPRMPQTFFRPFEIAGRITPESSAITGLVPGTPVAAGLYDVTACCLGSGILTPDVLCLVLGTWSICGHLEPERNRGGNVGTTLCSFRDGEYFLEESSPTSASNLDWFVDQYYRRMYANDPRNIYEICNGIVRKADPARSELVFLPYLYGSNSVQGAKGCFFNLASHHTGDDMLAAVYEGVLFSLMDHIERLYPGGCPAKARLSGGAARSDVWCQMLADILGVQVETTACPETGALGSAICAAIAGGVYAGYGDAVAGMVHIGRSYFPNAERYPVYRQKYGVYKRATEALEVFQRANRRCNACCAPKGTN